MTTARAQESSHDCDVAVNSDTHLKYKFMPRLILRGMMLTRFVRVVNNEQQQTAVKVSSCFLYDKSNEVNLMYVLGMCEKL